MAATTIADTLASWIAMALVPLIAYGLALLRRWGINQTVLAAIGRGAGAAYAELLRARDGATPAAIERAVDAGAEYVERRIPATLGKAGLPNTDSVRDVVRAELGKLLAADPTIGPKAGA
jgi:hypothetical protein